MDGVACDLLHGWNALWQSRYPDGPAFHPDKTSWEVTSGMPREVVAEAWAVLHEPGLFRFLPPLPGAVEAIRDIATRHDVFLCTAPVDSDHCPTEKIAWVREHLGASLVKRMILSHDKTLIHADLLIDDKPEITGCRTPSWEHVVFDQTYNAHVATKRRITWATWREALPELG